MKLSLDEQKHFGPKRLTCLMDRVGPDVVCGANCEWLFACAPRGSYWTAVNRWQVGTQAKKKQGGEQPASKAVLWQWPAEYTALLASSFVCPSVPLASSVRCTPGTRTLVCVRWVPWVCPAKTVCASEVQHSPTEPTVPSALPSHSRLSGYWPPKIHSGPTWDPRGPNPAPRFSFSIATSLSPRHFPVRSSSIFPRLIFSFSHLLFICFSPFSCSLLLCFPFFANL